MPDNLNTKSSKAPEFRPLNAAYDDKRSYTAPEGVVDWRRERQQTITTGDYQLTVFDVAAYILQQRGEMTTMKLHKLLYYCQAWSLVWDERPLFSDEIEAWANGPVIRKLFDFHRGSFSLSQLPLGNADLLSKNQRETVDAVLNFYGDKPTQWLVELTHLEDPWKEARRDLAPGQRGSTVISWESMANFYSGL